MPDIPQPITDEEQVVVSLKPQKTGSTEGSNADTPLTAGQDFPRGDGSG
ncbi:MAG: hypothetical protein ACR2MD_01080 [Aridibacter sp.]